MFGFRRRALAQKITEAISPGLVMFQRYYGLPTGFWDDPYVLGFISGQILAFKIMTGANKLSQSDQVYIAKEVLRNLSHINSDHMLDNLERANKYFLKDFRAGQAAGELSVLGPLGMIKNPEADSIFRDSKEVLRSAGASTSLQEIYGEVYRRAWFGELTRRFDLPPARWSAPLDLE